MGGGWGIQYFILAVVGEFGVIVGGVLVTLTLLLANVTDKSTYANVSFLTRSNKCIRTHAVR